VGLLATGVIGNTLEDVLALAVAGLASYVAVLNLPLKRADLKAKAAKRAGVFVAGVAAAMAEVRVARARESVCCGNVRASVCVRARGLMRSCMGAGGTPACGVRRVRGGVLTQPVLRAGAPAGDRGCCGRRCG
jgi:hypothetical protein